jgi:hypothetical protein
MLTFCYNFDHSSYSKNHSKCVKGYVKLIIPTVIKHVENKVNRICIIFWIRRMVKVVKKVNCDKYFNTEGVLRQPGTHLPPPSSVLFSFLLFSHLISSHLIYIHNLAIIQIIPSTILQSYRYTQDSHRTTFTRYNRLLVFLNIATSCTPSVGIRSTWVYRWVWMNPQAHKYIIVALYLRSIPKGI